MSAPDLNDDALREGEAGTSKQIRVDPDQIALFANACLRHANEGGTVSVRAFYDDELAKRRNEKPFRIRTVKLNGGGLEPVIQAVVKMAEEAAAAGRSVVVAPPICTFASGKADAKNVLEGLVLSLELDERAAEAVAKARALIGPPTVVMASGGEWTDLTTGELHDKLHVHWLLSEPTSGADEHRRLHRARSLLCDLVGADATSKSAVHPMRWPGTLHRKNPDAPRLARIVEHNPDSEVHLDDVLSELEGLAVMRGEAEDDRPTATDADPTGDDDLLLACAERIGNPDLEWAAWNRLGMAFWRASGGSKAGFEAFDSVSRKSAKYDAEATRARWDHYPTSPPSSVGAPTLVWEARKADPDFRKKRAEAPTEESAAPAHAGDWEATLEAAIGEMNARYFVAGMGGRGVIGSLVHDDALDRERLVLSRKDDVKLLYSHRHYMVGYTQKGAEIWQGLGDAWLDDWRRRTYDRIALLPEQETPPGVYNLWRGWGIGPKAGDWPLIHDHLMGVVCSGDQEHYAYLMGWLAYCVQHPERHAEVAVVLRGLKGTGKGTLGQMLVRMFRDHALHIMNSRHLTGHFNAHLADALFLFLDEAFWGGDKQGEGVLKALITERSIMIEPKGVDPFSMPNRLKILMASNADWVVPASADERRYFVLDVSEHRRGDLAYFDRLYAAMDGAELPAFLHHLRTCDLAGFKIRAVPHTKGLNSQKLIGADSVTKFWHDCLNEGAILGEGSYLWPELTGPGVVTQVLHACYVDHARQHGERFPDSAELLSKRLNQLWAGCDTYRHRPRCPWTDPQGNAIDRPQRYRLAELEDHRAAFLRVMQIEPDDHSWPAVRGDDR